ncbi:MAG TPA: FtsX-like permease family protein [Lacisediminihabitans sp.]|uniref:ABC transporter permease n=1 Tax=Lacisediminihabitans sp. TaxID=2787631 RepID=UPI002ED8F0C7
MRRTIREHGASVLVATLSAAFGVTLLEVTAVLSQLIAADGVTGSSKTVGVLLAVVAFVFIVIAVYVGAIVTANTFATIVAGRTRTIALLRLIGSSAAEQRRAVAREGLLVGIAGSVLGALIGTGLTAIGVTVSVARGLLPRLGYDYVEPVVLLPIGAVVVTTWLASWVGSRRVLQVSPVQATGVAVEQTREEAAGRHGRNVVALVLFATGIALLVLGILLGLVTPLGVLVGLIGGLLSFTGVVFGAHLVMPPALRLVGRMFGSSATARLAAENAVRYPERSSRTTIGLVIGVTLVTMFAVAVQSFQVLILSAQRDQPEVYAGTNTVLNVVVVVFSILMGFSALIAAVGMVNNLSMSVLQRTRELGLLRALGFTAHQVRTMIVVESAQLTVAAVLVGLVLGTFYGWAGAQSLLGSINGSPGVVVPAIPVALLGVIVGASLMLIVVASVAPSRRATRIAPVAALAVE